ncbi:MAG: alpha-ribazole phosphatase [Desulfobulbus propionicus]|nr:MAG: alpha-ribazole phosphatase [Desulfobulbus propionicus]
MTATRLYLIRHGETESNRAGVLMGSTDVPLNEHGREQAARLRDRINALRVDTVFSSPLQRTMETAAILFGAGQPIITDSSIQEFHFGEWEGLHYKEIEQQFPQQWQSWLVNWEETRIPGGEAFGAFKHRVITFVTELVAANSGRNLAVVSHGGCLRTLLAHLFCGDVGTGYWKFKVDNAALTEIEFFGDLPILNRFNYR